MIVNCSVVHCSVERYSEQLNCGEHCSDVCCLIAYLHPISFAFDLIVNSVDRSVDCVALADMTVDTAIGGHRYVVNYLLSLI